MWFEEKKGQSKFFLWTSLLRLKEQRITHSVWKDSIFLSWGKCLDWGGGLEVLEDLGSWKSAVSWWGQGQGEEGASSKRESRVYLVGGEDYKTRESKTDKGEKEVEGSILEVYIRGSSGIRGDWGRFWNIREEVRDKEKKEEDDRTS